MGVRIGVGKGEREGDHRVIKDEKKEKFEMNRRKSLKLLILTHSH